MTKTKKTVAALVLSLIMAFTARGTLAYFSSYRTTNGEAQMSLLPEAALSENLTPNSKEISVKNDGNTTIVVKIKAFLPTVDGVTFKVGEEVVSGEREWIFVVEPGASTETIKIDVEKYPEDIKPKFEIPVVYEYAPALYTDGEIDWYLINSTFFNRGKEG